MILHDSILCPLISSLDGKNPVHSFLQRCFRPPLVFVWRPLSFLFVLLQTTGTKTTRDLAHSD